MNQEQQPPTMFEAAARAAQGEVVVDRDGFTWVKNNAAEIKRPTATGPFTLGVIGAALGMISIVFPVAFILGLIGLPLSIVAYREHKRLARWSMALNALSIVLGVVGYFIVKNAFS